MPASFGTSGLWGLVTELTDDVITRYVQAFLNTCDVGETLWVGRDLRESFPHMSDVVIAAA